MNERIRLLSEQAHRSTADELADLQRMHNRTYDLNESAAIYNEKFAQLIVRECADILMKPEYVMNHPEELTDCNRGWVNGRLLGIEHIREHFGVES
jgi:hypothetical protein